MAKHGADVETVKAAYDAAQESNRRYRVHILGAVDLAEEITGQQFRGDSFNGRSRQSEARKVIDWPELERSIAQLVADGWLRQVGTEDAKRLQVNAYGATPTGRYYLSATDHAAAEATRARVAREAHRSRLMGQAKQATIDDHLDEVDWRYGKLLAAAGLSREEET
jgi:hypothetical protein